jgi:hypothetical protein
MTKVRDFSDLPAIAPSNIIPILQNAVDTGNFKTTIQDLMTFLVAQGFIQAAVDKPASEVVIADAGSLITATEVEGALQELATAIAGISGGGGGAAVPSLKTFSIDAMAVTVSYFGSTEPTFTGSNGSYTLGMQAGTEPKNVFLSAVNGSGPAGLADFTLIVTGDRNYNFNVQMTDLDNNRKFGPGQNSVVVAETSGSGQVTNLFTGIGSATTGFAINCCF